MALLADHHDFRTGRDDVKVSRADHFADLPRGEAGRSNFAAYLLGGVVVAGGMLAFLYYDSDNLRGGRDDLITGSITRLQEPAAAPAPSIRVPLQPAQAPSAP